MELHENTSYIVASVSGLLMIVWVITLTGDLSKSLGAGLMMSSTCFLFVGFFTQPKYEFGQFSIIANATLAQRKLEDLETHHKRIYGQRILEGTETIPTQGRLRSMTKAELVQISLGLEIPCDPDQSTKNQIIEGIIKFGDEKND